MLDAAGPAREALWLPSLFQVERWPLRSHGPHAASVTVPAVHAQSLISPQHKLRGGTSQHWSPKQAP